MVINSKRTRTEFETQDTSYEFKCSPFNLPNNCFNPNSTSNRSIKRRKITHHKTKVASFPVNLFTLTGTRLELLVEPNDRIIDLKEYVTEETGIPAPQQRIVYRGQVTVDEMTIGKYNISRGSNLHLVMALRGGQ
eukprot:gb/GECH01001589.1/.p1 GENE.gb/GECH01001589.1/~~gb/GECH01001589.1/.p1  ORF type:complete len:135 (+),score=20.64 gb/GECH01001589.1/:1-405(+)